MCVCVCVCVCARVCLPCCKPHPEGTILTLSLPCKNAFITATAFIFRNGIFFDIITFSLLAVSNVFILVALYTERKLAMVSSNAIHVSAFNQFILTNKAIVIKI